MYKIIGADQREYGPVPAEDVRRWILEGRANASTLAQVEGTAEWRPLESFPEWADALMARAAIAPPLPPILEPFDSAARLELYHERASRLDIGSCIERSWRLFWDRPGLLGGASALILLIHIAMESIPVVGSVAGVMFGLVLWAGLYWLCLKLIRGQPADVSDTFAGFQIQFLQLMLASIVTTLLIGIGLVLCILPGVYLMVAWIGFGPLLIIDRRMEFWPALELSRKVVTRNFWAFLALFLISLVLLVAGVLLLLVGLLVAVPLVTGAIVYAYEDIFGEISNVQPLAGNFQ